jgi:hypothetical protein
MNAKKISTKVVRENIKKVFTGKANLYKLSTPLEENEYVIVSTAKNSFVNETYIFPANEFGEIQSWGELPGSTNQPGHSHAIALGNVGYSIK